MEKKMGKPKIAFYWNASCGGCEESLLDLAEDILPVVEAVDIVFFPVAMDFKRKDVEALADGEIAVSFINGAIRTSEQEEMANLLRKKSKMVVAYGTCACMGGIPGLANFWTRKDIFDRVYKKMPTVVNPENTVPKTEVEVDGYKLSLPEFSPPDLILNAINAILKGELPEKGAVLAPDKSLCDTCPRAESKPEKISMKDIKRPYEVEIDTEKCFLEQGIICLGPATRSGCGERCINANMPCRGCFGPTKEVSDQGLKSLSFIASILGLEGEEKMSDEEVEKLLDKIVDPAGLFYMYSLPSSLLRRKR
jgi:F420-non-reducing hydrogenase small subunit